MTLVSPAATRFTTLATAFGRLLLCKPVLEDEIPDEVWCAVKVVHAVLEQSAQATRMLEKYTTVSRAIFIVRSLQDDVKDYAGKVERMRGNGDMNGNAVSVLANGIEAFVGYLAEKFPYGRSENEEKKKLSDSALLILSLDPRYSTMASKVMTESERRRAADVGMYVRMYGNARDKAMGGVRPPPWYSPHSHGVSGSEDDSDDDDGSEGSARAEDGSPDRRSPMSDSEMMRRMGYDACVEDDAAGSADGSGAELGGQAVDAGNDAAVAEQLRQELASYKSELQTLAASSRVLQATRNGFQQIPENLRAADLDMTDEELITALAGKPSQHSPDEVMLGWWALRAARFPALSYIVRCYFAAAGSTLPLESKFSLSTFLTRPRPRRSQKPTTTAMLLTLRQLPDSFLPRSASEPEYKAVYRE